MVDPLRAIIEQNRAGHTAALPSVCSAHRDVLSAAMLLHEASETALLIEATSNQVNQDGGYTSMRPVDFITYVHGIADECGFDRDLLIFGGDHLGPQAWKHLPADAAMDRAKILVGDYAKAGFTKIHLDCSEGCAGEPAHLNDTLVASRAAELAGVVENTAPNANAISYIVGTEVPVPGGARTHHDGVQPTDPTDAVKTMQAHLDCFQRSGLTEAAERIVGLVIQPGVEFGATEIDHLPDTTPLGMRDVLHRFPGLAFEAHSTDYQLPSAYPRLAQMGFAIQKVGPALTFAYRQAIYGLDAIDRFFNETRIGIADVLETEMLKDPVYWRGHYQGDEGQLHQLRHFSYSDRIRYYWPRPQIQTAIAQLFERLNSQKASSPLLLQYFDEPTLRRMEYLKSQQNGSRGWANLLVLATIQQALAPYFFMRGSLQ